MLDISRWMIVVLWLVIAGLFALLGFDVYLLVTR